MITQPEVTTEELAEWRTSHVTQKVCEWIKIERDSVSASFERGEILNIDNPVITHGNAARAWGQLESLKAMIDFIEGK
jgi:hypothetical protein